MLTIQARSTPRSTSCDDQNARVMAGRRSISSSILARCGDRDDATAHHFGCGGVKVAKSARDLPDIAARVGQQRRFRSVSRSVAAQASGKGVDIRLLLSARRSC